MRARALSIVVLVGFITVLYLPIVARAQAPSCANYPNQSAAQSAYRGNPFSLRVLDPGDGFACSDLACPCDPNPVLRPADPVDPTPSLLTLADLPAGWNERPSAAQATMGAVDDQNDIGSITARAEFARGVAGPFLSQTLVSLPSRLGDYIMPYLRERFSPRESEGVDANGLPTTTRLTLLPSFPTIGDDSFALRTDTHGASFDLQSDVVISRRGDLVSIISEAVASVGAARVDDAEVEQIARLADAKLAALAGGGASGD